MQKMDNKERTPVLASKGILGAVGIFIAIVIVSFQLTFLLHSGTVFPFNLNAAVELEQEIEESGMLADGWYIEEAGWFTAQHRGDKEWRIYVEISDNESSEWSNDYCTYEKDLNDFDCTFGTMHYLEGW